MTCDKRGVSETIAKSVVIHVLRSRDYLAGDTGGAEECRIDPLGISPN
jgi:hypothetical protein